MAFHRNNNGSNNRYNNNRQNFRPRHNNNSHHNNQQGGQRRHVNRINHVFESTGPDGRVRGTAQQLVEKYTSLARDAHASGDPVLMLNYYQHAEHYQRLYTEIMEENATFEREREAQRAQYNQQPTVEGDANFAPDTGNTGDGANRPADSASQPDAQQAQQRAPRAPASAEAGDTAATAPDSGSMSTGGRVMGRRPAGPRADNRPQANQLQDDHMPSFLKQDIPIKAAPKAAEAKPATDAPAPKVPKAASAETDGAVAADVEPAVAAFGKRRTPSAAARRASTPDAAAGSTETP
jgi:hypothetical protein